MKTANTRSRTLQQISPEARDRSVHPLPYSQSGPGSPHLWSRIMRVLGVRGQPARCCRETNTDPDAAHRKKMRTASTWSKIRSDRGKFDDPAAQGFNAY